MGNGEFAFEFLLEKVEDCSAFPEIFFPIDHPFVPFRTTYDEDIARVRNFFLAFATLLAGEDELIGEVVVVWHDYHSELNLAKREFASRY